MKKNEISCRAFTIVELLVVIAVIGVLGSILFTGANFLFGENSVKKAETQIEVLHLCIDEYKKDFGTYPITDDLVDFDQRGVRLLQILLGTHDENGQEIPEGQNRRSYMPLDRFEVLKAKDSEELLLIDPWQEPYLYSYPRTDGHLGYLLFSKGPDRKSQSIDNQSAERIEKTPEDMDNIPSTEPGKW